MRTAQGKIDLYHSTSASPSNGQLLPFDYQYIKCIPEANGPYAGDSNSGDQISGKVWLEELSEDLRKQVADSHLKLCIQPAWMLPESALIAVPRHMKWEDTHSRWLYAGSSAAGALYFHRYKGGRAEYIILRRHTIANIPRELSIDLNFTSVGDNTRGCDQLARACFPVPMTNVAEMTFAENTFVVESGCEVKTVIADGEYCKPDSVTFKDGDKVDRHNDMVQQVMAELKSKTKESSKSTKKKPANKPKKQQSKSNKSNEQSKSTGGKKSAKSRKNADLSDDDFSEEEIPKPTKKRAPAKAATSRKKKRQDDYDSDDGIQFMGAPARATASRARSTAKKPKYNYDDEDDDDDIVDEPPATKSKGRATASRARSTAKKPKYNYDDDDEIMDDDDFVEETPVEKPKGRGATKPKAKSSSKPAGRDRTGQGRVQSSRRR